MIKQSAIRHIVLLMAITINANFAQTADKLRWTTDSEALPQNSIKSIAPDKHGFLWLTTENGLVRYDGQEFKVYNSANSGFQNNRFVSIHGNFNSDSLFTFNDYQEDIVLINQRNAKILKGRERLRGRPPGIDRTKPFISQGVPSMLFDVPKRPYIIPSADKSYFLISAGRISLFNEKNTLVFTTHFEYENIGNFVLISNLLYYIREDGSYSLITKDKITQGKLAISNKFPFSLFWNVVSNQVFIYTDKNLYEIQQQENELTKALIIQGEDLSTYDISCVYYDRNDNIVFLGSFKNGLGTYRTAGFNTLSPGPVLPSLPEIFYAMHPFTDTLAISATGLVMSQREIINDLKFTSDRFDMAIDSRGDVWVSSLAYLYRYTKVSGYKKIKKWHFPHGITTICKGAGDVMWFTTNTLNDERGTLYRFRSSDDIPKFEKVTDINTKVNFLVPNNNLGIFMATRLGLQIYKFSDSKVHRYINTESLNIRSLYIPDRDHIWIMTYEKGFFLLENGKLTAFPADRNNYLQSTHCIIEDKKGYFWLTTNKGLFQVKEQNLLNYVKDQSTPIYYHYYNKEYGFLSNEFNGGCQPCGIKLENDVVFLPSIKGAVTFKPSEITPRPPHNEIFIDEIIVNGNKITVADTISIDRNFDRITFYVSSPYFGHRANLNYEVRISGPGDQEWLPFSNANNISFTKLPPGDYTISVRKLRGFDGDYNYKTIFISISPAFWQTVWFKISAILFGILLLIVFYRIRTNLIRSRNLHLERAVSERTSDLLDTISTLRSTRENLNTQIDNNTKIIQYITHDIKSPLKFMAMAGKHMYETFQEKQEDLKENLKAIYTSSNQMYNFVSNLLDYSKAYLDPGEKSNAPFNLFNLVSEKTAIFDSIVISQRTTIRNVVPPRLTIAVNRQMFAIIMHNLIDNATKNTFNGKIMITAFQVGHQTHVVISDTGNGMNEETLSKYRRIINEPDEGEKDIQGLGLHIISELLLILNGRLKIDSKPDIGTTVTLIFNQVT